MLRTALLIFPRFSSSFSRSCAKFDKQISRCVDGTKLAYGDDQHETPGMMELMVPLTERGWYQLLPGEHYHGESASRDNFMDVLVDVSAMMLRARFHLDQDEVSDFSSTVVSFISM